MIQPFELLENAASLSPNKIGLVSESRVLTFLEMRDWSHRLGAEFHSRGVRARSVVSTFLPPDLDWLSTLGIFHEAAVPVSLWGVGQVTNLEISWFVSTSFHASVPSQKTLLVDSALLTPGSPGENHHQRTLYARPDKPMRYVMTSGTTGTPKAVTFTGGNIQARLNQLDSYWTDSRPELNFMGLSTTGGFFSALAALRHGNPYLAEVTVDQSAIERALEYRVKVIAGSTSQIGAALNLIREHKTQLPDLEEIRVAGSMPSEKLVSAIHHDLGVKVKSVYGSTEGGGVAVTILRPGDDVSDLGTLVIGVELEIEKEDGVSGQIRYRGPGLSPGYLAETVSDSNFAEGWFYPGDRGYLSEKGHLILEGRTDEIMNFGGTKLNPAKVEELAKEFDGVMDAAVCLVERLTGIEEVAIAIVGAGAIDLRGLDQMLRAKLPIGHPTVFTTTRQIPRNLMGKIVRTELKLQILKDLKLS